MGKPKPTSKKWQNGDIEKALAEIRVGKSIRASAKKYGMAESTLRNRMTLISEGKEMVGSGRRTVLKQEEEAALAKCINALCNSGFSPSSDEIKNLVRDYVRSNSMKTPFKDDRPGREWFNNFMNRNRLSTKKATIISAARKAATCNPFIVYDFYEKVEEVINAKSFGPTQIWNCDESGFPTDPSKCKVVAPIGKPGWKTTPGAGRENITVLATCSASGQVLDPLVIFSGKNFQNTWKGREALPKTLYGISDNGWMTTDVFHDWFLQFAKQVTVRPLLLIYDGHLSHVSIDVIEKAIEEDITILKFPPHVTDKLQPLDVSCFSPLKRKWEALLAERGNVLGPRETINKSTFVDLLCSIWHEGLSPANATSGFRSTGIYPIDKTRYPTSRFDPRLLKRYEYWLELGKPEDLVEEMVTSVNTPKKKSQDRTTEQPIRTQQSITDSPISHFSIDQQPTSKQANTSTPTLPTHDVETVCNCTLAMEVGPCPAPIPGHKWVLGWTLLKDQPDKSFEELVLDRIKGPQERKPVKRRKIDVKTKVITEATYLEKLKETTKETKKPATKKHKKKCDNNDDDDDENEIFDDNVLDDAISDGEKSFSDFDEEESHEIQLKKLWRSLTTEEESSLVNRWYGGIWEEVGKRKKKEVLFIGKALHRFREDADGPIIGFELDCLETPVGDTTVLKSRPKTLHRDIDVFAVWNIIASVQVTPLKGDQWSVPSYGELKQKFKRAITMDRKELYNKL